MPEMGHTRVKHPVDICIPRGNDTFLSGDTQLFPAL